MTDKEALKLALEALDIVKLQYTQNRHVNEAIAAINEALAQPAQEPVSDTEILAWAERHDVQGTQTDLRSMFEDAASLSTPPAAQPEQEMEQPEIFCGVDYADGVLAVSVMRRRPDDVAKLLHMEQIELAQPEERNFCPRCGKRTADLTTIHTCTPPIAANL
jgi:hypothetical protein